MNNLAKPTMEDEPGDIQSITAHFISSNAVICYHNIHYFYGSKIACYKQACPIA